MRSSLYSVERTKGVHFITMELVHGRLLSEVTPPEGMDLGMMEMTYTKQ